MDNSRRVTHIPAKDYNNNSNKNEFLTIENGQRLVGMVTPVTCYLLPATFLRTPQHHNSTKLLSALLISPYLVPHERSRNSRRAVQTSRYP
jgi:hypothetical protein